VILCLAAVINALTSILLLSRRWNTLKADEVGLHLQLLPVLLGFFTYKGAVIARGALDLFAGLTASPAVQPLHQQAAQDAPSQLAMAGEDARSEAAEPLQPSAASGSG